MSVRINIPNPPEVFVTEIHRYDDPDAFSFTYLTKQPGGWEYPFPPAEPSTKETLETEEEVEAGYGPAYTSRLEGLMQRVTAEKVENELSDQGYYECDLSEVPVELALYVINCQAPLEWQSTLKANLEKADDLKDDECVSDRISIWIKKDDFVA